MANRFISDLVGTMKGFLRIGGTAGVRLKNSSGHLLVRNAADTADADLTAALVSVSGDELVINSDAADTGTDRSLTVRRNAAAAANLTLVAPPAKGTDGHVLRQKAGTAAGVLELELVAAGDTSASVTADTTPLAHNSSSTVSMFTLPANAVVMAVKVKVDTVFNGTSPSMSVGVSGNASKYMGSTDVDLAATGVYEVDPGLIAVGSTEALQIAFTAAGGSPSAGAARVEVHYAVPT